MCAPAIRWAGFKEYIYGTNMYHLIDFGWDQIAISSDEVVARSWNLGTKVNVVRDVGRQFTDPFFEWQYREKAECPLGCKRRRMGNGEMTCEEINLKEPHITPI
jgi:hypothetical protein